MIIWAAGYLMLINLLTYWAFYVDKRRAQARGRRISEANLLTLAMVGGTAGAIAAQQRFRHKTKKQPFKAQLYIIAVLQFLALVVWAVPPFRAELLALVA